MTLHQIKTAEINSAVITGAGEGKKKGGGGRKGMFSVKEAEIWKHVEDKAAANLQPVTTQSRGFRYTTDLRTTC